MYRSMVGVFFLSSIAACATDALDPDGAIAEAQAASTGTCTYSIKRDNIKVIHGEGGFDPALELSVDTSVQHDGTSSTNNFSGTIKVGASNATDVTIYTNSVPDGTLVSHDWDVDAIEFDTLSAHDHGTGGGTLVFTCSGTGTSTDSDQVTLGNATIDVQVKATW